MEKMLRKYSKSYLLLNCIHSCTELPPHAQRNGSVVATVPALLEKMTAGYAKVALTLDKHRTKTILVPYAKCHVSCFATALLTPPR